MRIDRFTQSPKVAPAPPSKSAPGSRNEQAKSGDRVELAQLLPGAEVLSAKVRSMPAEDNPRLQEIQQRVRSGYYEARQVREQIADALVAADPLREVFADIAQVRATREKLSEVADTRQQRVEQARLRANSGFYEAPDIRRDTAARILEDLI